MYSLLEKLWDFYLSEHPFETDDDKRALVAAISDAEEALLSSLDDKQQQLFRTFFELQSDCQACAERDAFIGGMRFAAEFFREIAE